MVQIFVVEFDEFVDDVMFVQYLYDFQYQIGGCDVFVQCVGDFEVYYFGDQYGNWLVQYCGFGFDFVDVLVKDGKVVDYGGVVVCVDQCVGIGDFVFVLIGVGLDGLCQIFKVDLMVDVCVWWYYVEVVEGVLFLFQKGVMFKVVFVFQFYIVLEGVGIVEFVDYY